MKPPGRAYSGAGEEMWCRTIPAERASSLGCRREGRSWVRTSPRARSDITDCGRPAGRRGSGRRSATATGHTPPRTAATTAVFGRILAVRRGGVVSHAAIRRRRHWPACQETASLCGSHQGARPGCFLRDWHGGRPLEYGDARREDVLAPVGRTTHLRGHFRGGRRLSTRRSRFRQWRRTREPISVGSLATPV